MMILVLSVLLFAYMFLANIVFVKLDGKMSSSKGYNILFILAAVATSVGITKLFTPTFPADNWLEICVNSGFCILALLGVRDLLFGAYRKDDGEFSFGVLRIVVSFVLPFLYVVLSFSLFSANFTASPLSKVFGLIGVGFLGFLVYLFLRDMKKEKSESKKNPLKGSLLPSLALFVLYLCLMCILFISPAKPPVVPENEWLGGLGISAFLSFSFVGMREAECGSRYDNKKRFSIGMQDILIGMIIFFVFFALMYKI